MSAARILIVDDNATIRETLDMTLRFKGYDVTQAGTGEEALQIMDGQTFDLVFCDLAMPGMGGRRLIERIRGDLGLRDLPLIVLSAEEREQKDAALSAGANDSIDKPFTPMEVLNIVEGYLS